jgi:hypothetical protein
MEDPLPENIEGEKRVVHTVNHNVNWSHVALAALGILFLLKFGPALLSASDDEEIGDEEDWA